MNKTPAWLHVYPARHARPWDLSRVIAAAVIGAALIIVVGVLI